MSLAPTIEAAALRETEDYLREFIRAASNTGIGKPSLALMLRAVADELDPPLIVTGMVQ